MASSHPAGPDTWTWCRNISMHQKYLDIKILSRVSLTTSGSADDLGGVEPLELEVLALGHDGLQLRVEVGERRGVRGLLGHVTVQALLAVLEAGELLLDARHHLARLSHLGRARARRRVTAYAVRPARRCSRTAGG